MMQQACNEWSLRNFRVSGKVDWLLRRSAAST
jgi:hypothetical protein